ncbi:hypothetical protein B0H15DRAFT_38785 [Mycena belliarum]|uniref:Secreted protein n=1 Tax=Mycena belliarum TaxID=1033014 RepID=A0AAD6XJ81_9AGAR|nr:hypothetical protein B0H15DRAFT_38785 [Mycena belliae]
MFGWVCFLLISVLSSLAGPRDAALSYFFCEGHKARHCKCKNLEENLSTATDANYPSTQRSTSQQDFRNSYLSVHNSALIPLISSKVGDSTRCAKLVIINPRGRSTDGTAKLYSTNGLGTTDVPDSAQHHRPKQEYTYPPRR